MALLSFVAVLMTSINIIYPPQPLNQDLSVAVADRPFEPTIVRLFPWSSQLEIQL
jgi:hypothetical protein